MPARKRTAKQREADLVLVAEGLNAGQTYREIAADINAQRDYTIGWEQVKKDTVEVRERWKQTIAWNGDEVLFRVISNLNFVVGQAKKAWERSKENYAHASKTTKTGLNGKNERSTAFEVATQRTGSRVGDPRFLALIQSASMRAALLYGLVAKDAEPPAEGEEDDDKINVTVVIKSNKSPEKLLDFPIKKAVAREIQSDDEDQFDIEDVED